MKKIVNFFVNHYCSILSIILFVVAASNLVCENDLFFDLKTGEDILKNGLTFKDHFSFIPGLTYVYLHWFYDIFIYFIYSISGLGGLYILFTLTTLLFFILFYYEIYKITKNKLISIIVVLITFFMTKYAFLSRVQTIIYLLLFIELLLLEKLYKTGSKKYSIYLILISILVVNLQMPIWIFYLILTLPYIVESIMSKIFNNTFEKCSSYKILYITFILICISAFISPYGLIPYTYCFKSLGNQIYTLLGIMEMKPTILLSCRPIIGITMVFVFTSYFKWLRLPFRDLCLISGLFLFSLIVYKNIIFYLLFGMYILIKNINIDVIKDYIIIFYNKINIKILEIFIIVLLTIAALNVFSFKYLYFNNYGYSFYPDKIVNYLKNNTDYKNIKLYSDFNNGSFFLFNDIKVFVDSRAEVYIKEYNGGNDIFSDYIKLNEYETYKDILDKYDFDYLVVSGGSDLFKYLFKEEGYCFIDSYYEYILFEKYKEKIFLR